MESRGACPAKIDVVDILTICVVLTGFANMYCFIASTISSLETYVIMWSYGGLSHWCGVCLGLAGVGCSVRDPAVDVCGCVVDKRTADAPLRCCSSDRRIKCESTVAILAQLV